jgi:predicted metal-dependent HD superfamily phosphohydrolase
VTEWKIASIRESDLELEAAALYSAALPYHNFEHAVTTIGAAERILVNCVAEGIRVDPKIVYYALLFHDAGYHRSHLELGYASKEAYSAALALESLRRRKLGPHLLKKVESAILCTKMEARVVTAEQKTVRAADLSGLAADYGIFLGNTVRLWQEYALLTGQYIEWSGWVSGTADIIRGYLAQEIRLTSYFANNDGESVFHLKARTNLQRLQSEPEPLAAARA